MSPNVDTPLSFRVAETMHLHDSNSYLCWTLALAPARRLSCILVFDGVTA